ncbi:MAG: leucyl/phenylalanyl-tRNA--protein transferase [Planctomycetota bacterium]|nr:leucyl/phenylalanyl-tRNA--protein transferase [Planctomycetota bacterium]
MTTSPVDNTGDDLPTHPTAVVGRILELYAQGWFPMGDLERNAVEWVQPRRRAVLSLTPVRLHVARSLRSLVRRKRFEIRCDTAFEQVIVSCAQAERGGSWLHPAIVDWFLELHRLGLAHSIEAWLREESDERNPASSQPSADSARLVGGLYGLSVGSVFCGESMFSNPAAGGSNASKVCFVHLISHLEVCGFAVLDSQISNPHMHSLGVEEVPARAYLKKLRELSGLQRPWLPFDPERALAAMEKWRAGQEREGG